MNTIKRMTAILMAVLMLATSAVVANAATIDEEEKKNLTDEIFEYRWYSGLYNWYWEYTKSTVKIENNPLAAMVYMMIEAEVEICDQNSLQELSDGNITIKEFYEKNEKLDFEKAKQKDKFKNSLILGYECFISRYQYGTWEFGLKDDDYSNVYGYFKEDVENFTLYEEETDKVLGVYPKLIGYEYLDDSDDDTTVNDSGANGGGTGGSGSGNNGSFADSANSSSSTGSAGINNDIKKIASGGGKVESSETSTENNVEKSDPDGNNPAVTPEIASAVDEMKSAAQTQSIDEDKPVSAEPIPVDKPSHTVRNVILIIAAVAIIVVGAVMFLKKKGEKNGK